MVYRCSNCGNTWQTNDYHVPKKCPGCSSKKIIAKEKWCELECAKCGKHFLGEKTANALIVGDIPIDLGFWTKKEDT